MLMIGAAPLCGPIGANVMSSAGARRSLYGWSEDKARQYAEPTRTDFGCFVRGKGFRLD